MISLHIGVCPATAHRGEFAAPQSQASPGVASRYKVYGGSAHTWEAKREPERSLVGDSTCPLELPPPSPLHVLQRRGKPINWRLGLVRRGVVDVRGRADFSRFDPRPERPHFSNFGPPAERRPFCGAKTFLSDAACALRSEFSRFDPRPEPTLRL